MADNRRQHKKKPRSANKIGRNKIKCERYRRENRREHNKARRARRTMAKSKKDKNLGHVADDNGVCKGCGLTMAYLLMAKAECVAPFIEPEQVEEPIPANA